MKKQFYYLVGLGIGLVGLIILQIPSSKARMVVCDVGQGDAILIIKGRTQVLIDGGPSSEKILACLERQLPFWDRRIDLIVMTNSDFDHMNGLSAVLERYQVMQFVTSDGVHKGEGMERLARQLTKAKIEVGMVGQGDEILILGQDKLKFSVLWPSEVQGQYGAVWGGQLDNVEREQLLAESAKRGNLNERSLVLLLLEDNKKILLMGDAGDQAEKRLLEQGLLNDVDILKVGHHGSKYASGAEFLSKVRPEMAIISVGAKNRYGHPTSETLGRLNNIGSEVKRTDKLGSIVIEL